MHPLSLASWMNQIETYRPFVPAAIVRASLRSVNEGSTPLRLRQAADQILGKAVETPPISESGHLVVPCPALGGRLR